MKNKIEFYVVSAINKFYEKDSYLVEIDAHERTCVARIAHYLQNLLDCDQRYNDLSVDCEYNRQIREGRSMIGIKNTKKNTQKRIVPDLIVHCRGNNKKNLLVAEVKMEGCFSRQEKDKDVRRVRALVEDTVKHYKLGLFICLGKEGYVIERFVD